MKKYKVTRERVDGCSRAVLYQWSEGYGGSKGEWVFVRDLDLHSQLSFAEAKRTLLYHAN
jgi:hypothetical protein